MSSQALMCNGGDLFLDSSVPLFDPDYETDDEDDDDDDGHSSMLSNASVRRARASANGASESTRERMAAPTGTFFHSIPSEKNSQSAFLAKKSILSIRGGATTNLGSEFAKRLLVGAIVTLAYEALLGHFFEFGKPNSVLFLCRYKYS
jgi:hypothetical protein